MIHEGMSYIRFVCFFIRGLNTIASRSPVQVYFTHLPCMNVSVSAGERGSWIKMKEKKQYLVVGWRVGRDKGATAECIAEKKIQ